MKKAGSKRINFSWIIGGLGVFINLAYFGYEYLKYGSLFLEHISDLIVEHVVIFLLIPLFAVLAILVERESHLQSELEAYATHLESTVAERTQELEESNRLRELFSDILVHDLLNPIGSAKNAVEIAIEEDKDEDLLKMARRNLDRSIELIENASRYSKITDKDHLKLKPGDLVKTIESVVKDFEEPAKEKDVKIYFEPKKKASAMMNPVIQEAFSNLLSNAIKYSPKGGEVSITLNKHNSLWKIGVEDQGEGIKDKDKELIFNRFKRVEKGGVKGTGLGLAIVKKTVELHDGNVWVEDGSDGGSIFYVEIPGAN